MTPVTTLPAPATPVPDGTRRVVTVCYDDAGHILSTSVVTVAAPAAPPPPAAPQPR